MSCFRSRRAAVSGLMAAMLLFWNPVMADRRDCISYQDIPGPEDFVLDEVTAKGPRLIISSQDRCRKSSDGELLDGRLYSVPIRDGNPGRACPINTHLSGFRPHGLALQDLGEGSLRLFVVNHGSEEAIVSFEIGADGEFKTDNSTSYTNAGLLTQGNDLAVSRDRVYVSNNGSFAGLLLPWSKPGRVVTFEIGDDTGARTWTELKTRFRYANGVAALTVDENPVLYIADSGRRQVMIIRPGDGAEKSMAIPVKGLVDNFTWNPEQTDLLVTAHLSLPRFALHMSCRKFGSPSAVYRIDTRTYRLQRIAPESLAGVNAASTALLYEDTLYIGKVFDPGITVIPNAEKLFEDYRR